jgi:hypothetical protein
MSGARPSPWWKSPTHLTAVIGLVLTLGGILVGVWVGVRQDQQARLYSQLGLLTQLSSEARVSDRAVLASHIPALRCEAHYSRGDLSERDEETLDESLDIYDVMAWIFNQHLAPDSAAPLLGPRILDMRAIGLKLLSPSEVARNWTELARYRSSDVERLPDGCA